MQKFSSIYFNGISLWAKKNKRQILKTVNKIIASGIFLNGPQSKQLEKKLLKLLGRGYLTTTSSGHSSLSLALAALNLKKGDEIIFPVNAYPTAFAIANSNTTLVPVDVDENGQLDTKELEKKINKNTKAIIVVHLYGLTGNLDGILRVAKEKGIFLIEDCAQSFGSKYNGRLTGTLGDIGCFSFYPTKNLPTLGDGGFIFTRHKKIFDFIKKAKSYGESKRYHSEFLSGHSRIGEIQAGITDLYLKNIKREFKTRKKLFRYYQKRIKENNLPARVLTSNKKSDSVNHLFVIFVKKRNQLQRFLKKRNIETHIHYPTPIHLLPAFSFLRRKRGNFKTSEKLAKGILSLPFHRFLTKREIDYIVNLMEFFYDKKDN